MHEFVELFWGLAILSLVVTILLLVVLGRSRSKKASAAWMAAMAAVTVAAMGSTGVLGWLGVTARMERNSVEARAHEQFVRQVRPIADELTRLEFLPALGKDFYHEASYSPNGGSFALGGTGEVAVRNSKGKLIWLHYQLVPEGVRIGCFDGTLLVSATPFGARQLRATLGCETLSS